MTQFKDCISEGLCFQILNMQFCLSPCHKKPRLIKWSNLQKPLLQQTPPRQAAAVPLPFDFAFPIPTERHQPTRRCDSICSLLICLTTCLLPLAGTLPMSTLPSPPPRLDIGTQSHLCPSLSQASTARAKWQEAYVEKKRN